MSIRINGDNTAANPGITGADTDTGLSFGTNEVSINTDGTERFRVGSSGELGIGGATYGTNGQVLTSQGSGSAPQWSTIASDSITEGNTSVEVVDTGSDGHITFDTDGTERMRVTNNGYVRFGDGTNYYHTIRGGGGNEALEITANAGQQSANAVSNIKFFTSNAGGTITERVRIKQAGEITVGDDNAHATGYGNSITGATEGDHGTYFGIGDHGNGTNAWSRHSGDSTYTHINFVNVHGSRGSITTTVGSTQYNTTSDYRLKENVVPLSGAADRLNQLSVHRFNFIVDPDNTVDGFLAHEAQTVVPEAVTGTHDEVDADGNPVYQSIDQAKLVPLLTAALQEALAKIETLETRLTALEGGTN